MAGVRNEADAKLLSEKQRQIADLQNQLKTLEEKLESNCRRVGNGKRKPGSKLKPH